MTRPRRAPPLPIPAGRKYCWSCSSHHPSEQFATDRAKWDGLRHCCRSCDAARVKVFDSTEAGQRSLARRRYNWAADKARLEARFLSNTPTSAA